MRKFWEVRAAEDKPTTGELLLYGPIGPDDGMGWLFDEVTPKQFKADLDALGDIAELRVFINSGGGDVFAGQAIYSMLSRHTAKVTVFIDGLAASIASIVAMAGDTVIMPRNAMMMIHNPWTIGIGDAREFRKLAETLDAIRESMFAAYESKTNLTRSELIPLLNAETWLTAKDAVEKGFADEIEESKKIAASLVRPGVWAINGQEFDLSHYHNTPDDLVQGDDAILKPTKREIERSLRDVGYSQAEAKTILAGKQHAGELIRDVEAPQLEVSAGSGRSRTEQDRLKAESDRILARIKRDYAMEAV